MTEERKSLQSNKKSSLQPLWIALAVIAGLVIGTKVVNQGQTISFKAEDKQDKLANILDFIDRNYVDTLNRDALVDNAIQSIVEDLDPHSVYISRDEYTTMNEPLEGGFEGIGIEFMIVKDTLTVVTPLDGGPSAAAGIRTGDQIVKVEAENIAGNGLTNAQVLKLLKGKKGTSVQLGIQRKNVPQLIEFNIKRDKIPIESVVAALKVTDEIGYIKVTRFARQTNDEFFDAIDKHRR